MATHDQSNLATVFARGNASAISQGELTSNERILLESACVELIGSIEQMLEQSAKEREAGYLGESAVIGNKILLSLVDFSEGYVSGESLGDVYKVIAECYKGTQQVIDLATSQTWGPFRKMLGKSTASNDEVAVAHKDCGSLIADALETSVGSGLSRLNDTTSVAAQLTESLEPILTELRTEW
ncbi:MAG: hypothetical protein AAFV88_14570 [Planctomycetota bacterium]